MSLPYYFYWNCTIVALNDSLVTSLEELKKNNVVLATFNGTTSTTVQLSEPYTNFPFVYIEVLKDGDRIGTQLIPSSTLGLSVSKIYCGSTSSWASVGMSTSGYDKLVINRTTANTTSVRILGIRKFL